MDELDRDLANGLLGEDQIDRSLSGDLTGAYQDEAAREVISRPSQYRQLNGGISGPAVPTAGRYLLAVLGVLAVALVLLTVLGVH